MDARYAEDGGDRSSPENSVYGDIPDGYADMSSNFSEANLDKKTTDAVALAKTGKNKVGPMVYEVEIPMRGANKDEFSLLVIGCTGDKSQGQKDIGKMMANHRDAAAIIHLGDAFYTRGLQSLADKKMVEERLTGPYDDVKHVVEKPSNGLFDEARWIEEHLKMFCTAGNHDGDFRNIGGKVVGTLTGSVANPLENYIALTYFDPSLAVIQKKIEYFSQRNISLSSPLVGRIFFPYPFYSVIFGKAHQKIFFNTCTIVADFIRYAELQHTVVSLKKRMDACLDSLKTETPVPLETDTEEDIFSYQGFQKLHTAMQEKIAGFDAARNAKDSQLAEQIKAEFASIVTAYKAALAELQLNQIAWCVKDVLPEAYQEKRQIAVIGHHSPEPSTDRATTNNDRYEYISTDQYKQIVALLGFDPSRTHNMYKMIAQIYALIGLRPFQVFAAHEHCTSITNSLATNPEDPYPLRLCTAGSGGDKAHSQHRATHRTFPNCTYFRTGESSFVKASYSGSKPMSFRLQAFSLDGLEHRFNESSVIPFAMPVLNENLEKLRTCVFKAYTTYCETLKQIDEDHAIARALAKTQPEQPIQVKPQQPAPSAPPSSTYSWSGLKAVLYSGVKSVKDGATYVLSSARRAYIKQTRDTVFEAQLVIIQKLFAYFSQFHLNNLKFDACFNKLVDCVIELSKTTEDHPSTISFIAILNAEIQKEFANINLYDSIPRNFLTNSN